MSDRGRDEPVMTTAELSRDLTRRFDELSRNLARLQSDLVDARQRNHEANDRLNVSMGKLSNELTQAMTEHATRLTQHDKDIVELKGGLKATDKAVNNMRANTAAVAVGVSLISNIASAFGLPWGKH